MCAALPEVRCCAPTHFELGRQVGEAMAVTIERAFSADSSLKALLEFCAGPEGRELLSAFEKTNRSSYPHIMEEVEGIAAGSGQSLDAVLLANMAQELSTFDERAAPVVGCTDYHVLSQDTRVSCWGHTEDVLAEERGYIVHSVLVAPQEAADGAEPAVLASYTAFAYPGCVAGWAWGFNQHGIAFSINALTPARTRVGLAASFVSRDVLDAIDMDDAIARATVPSQGGGQRFNIGSVVEPGRRLLIEASPQGCELRQLAPGERSAVCNVYLFGLSPASIEGRKGPYAESSHRRLARAMELAQASEPGQGAEVASDVAASPSRAALELQRIARVLSDRADPEFPIWRDGTAPDYAVSDHCVIFDLPGRRVEVYRGRHVEGQPQQPQHAFAMPNQPGIAATNR